MSYVREKSVALEAVTEAAQLCAAVRAEMVGANALEKSDKSPVTIADFGSQALVCRRVIDAFPHDNIVGEEDSADLRKPEHTLVLRQVTQYVQRLQPHATSEMTCEWIDYGGGAVADRFWTVDPIDGTKGFLRNDQYAIALALIEGGDVRVGALACPALHLDLNNIEDITGVLFVAVRGKGAAMAPLGTTDFHRIHVARASDDENLRFVESVEAAHGDQPLQRAIAQAAGISQPSLRMDSQAKYGAVARGDAALYLRLPSAGSPDYREKIWDHAAGALIVEEAGGRVTDMRGEALDFSSDYKMKNNRGVIVSNGNMHAPVIEALAHYMAASENSERE